MKSQPEYTRIKPFIVAFSVNIAIVIFLFQCTPDHSYLELNSPDGQITMTFEISDEGSPYYKVSHNGNTVIQPSLLGVDMDDINFSEGLTLLEVGDADHVTPAGPEVVEDHYTLVHGKVSEAHYLANEVVYHLQHESGAFMDIVFRVSNDGVAFKYRFHGESDEPSVIHHEYSSYIFPEEARAWITPLADVNTGFAETNPSYEEQYFKGVEIEHQSPPGRENGWAYPALFRVDDSWLLISEAGLGRDYAATRLRDLEGQNGYHVGFPDPKEVMTGDILGPESTLPWESPWRFIVVGDLATIVESTLSTDLAEPNKLDDVSFIKPGRSSWSWVKLKDESMRFDIQKEFVEYAADMGWEYTLVDALWDVELGYDGLEELSEYAQELGVELLVWYNSAGDWNVAPQTPRDKMVTREIRRREFERISEIGISGVKVDFFAGDGQSVINYYIDIFEDAADFGLTVNTHGSTIPRGWHRTWPNLVTMESVKGFEYITFTQQTADSAASHGTMQPFTRNVSGPMDFTPVSLDTIPGIHQRTSNAFELATAIVYYSAIQHMAEVPEGMDRAPEFARQFLMDVPATWDDTRYIKGVPGELAVIARRSGDTWYVGGMNGDDIPKTIEVDLSKLEGAETGYLISDGESLRDLNYGEVTISSENPFTIDVIGNGGFVFVLSGS